MWGKRFTYHGLPPAGEQAKGKEEEKTGRVICPRSFHAYNCTTTIGAISYSPFYLLFGRSPRLPEVGIVANKKENMNMWRNGGGGWMKHIRSHPRLQLSQRLEENSSTTSKPMGQKSSREVVSW
ncbi:hypothetical protein N1851_013025 [Merluccius polli]|uniref:Uncharacterized protein n=1 Tax=Merluccius polli TaxID=89951 RepID=A0AA47MVQ4_MERPO|nr:hypothetical protein N1851_013025 [Merluccius polli]